MDTRTIVAVSTPAGRAARAIVRLSGSEAISIASKLFAPDDGPDLAALPSFRSLRGRILKEEIPCRLYLMRAPRSYTRQDVVEFHLPGNPLVAELALEAAVAAGARLAEPGEFTRRALENGRISADQAEAVLNLIRARSRAELSAAAEGLSGHAGRRLAGWRERAETLAAEIEAELDYGEVPGGFITEESAAGRLAALGAELDALIEKESAGEDAAGDSGAVRVALAGATNAGKSLLFRRLTGEDVLVSDEPGTTRDVLEAPLRAAPDDVVVLDTAGPGAAAGEVELLAAAVAQRAWRCADLLVLVLDRSAKPSVLPAALAASRRAEVPVVLALNKCDLPAAVGAREDCAALDGLKPAASVETSALTGEGCDQLAELLKGLVHSGSVERSAARTASSARRREVLGSARQALSRAETALGKGLDLSCAADDFREAARTVAGHFEPGAGQAELDESVLDRIFAHFCVGK